MMRALAQAVEATEGGSWAAAEAAWAEVVTLTPSAINYANRGNLYVKCRPARAGLAGLQGARRRDMTWRRAAG